MKQETIAKRELDSAKEEIISYLEVELRTKFISNMVGDLECNPYFNLGKFNFRVWLDFQNFINRPGKHGKKYGTDISISPKGEYGDTDILLYALRKTLYSEKYPRMLEFVKEEMGYQRAYLREGKLSFKYSPHGIYFVGPYHCKRRLYVNRMKKELVNIGKVIQSTSKLLDKKDIRGCLDDMSNIRKGRSNELDRIREKYENLKSSKQEELDEILAREVNKG